MNKPYSATKGCNTENQESKAPYKTTINNQTYHKQKPNLSYQSAIVNSYTIGANPKNNYLQSRHIVATLVVGRALRCPPLRCSHPIYTNTTEIKPRITPYLSG
jgi:hypothetical protein